MTGAVHYDRVIRAFSAPVGIPDYCIAAGSRTRIIIQRDRLRRQWQAKRAASALCKSSNAGHLLS